MAKIYSNPRISATIENWPHGSQRVAAHFEIETNGKHGQRATRTTTGATKKLTYAKKARIVDCDDGKTYIAEISQFGIITIMRGDMKYNEEVIYRDDPKYSEVIMLFGE